MDAAEYANLAALEREHWYYSGKRRLVRAWIARVRPPARDDLLLDCGAGTGLFAQEMSALCRIMVLDDHEEALRILRTRFQPEQIISLTGDRVPLPDASLEYVTALDVLEHVPDDAAVVRGFHRLLKPGGLAVVTVPASMALWSDWDVALHHFRRYDREQLQAIFPEAAWEVVHVNYTNVLVYPAVWAVRKWRAWRQRVGAAGTAAGTGARSEDRIPPRWINAILRAVFVGMARWRVRFPFGVSLLLVARRRRLSDSPFP
jgi:SAM-dependent methyltransferase